MSILMNRVILVNGRRTSMRMSKKEWNAFDEICAREKLSRNELLGLIEEQKSARLGLTYSTRLFILAYFHSAATESGHHSVGHCCENRDILKSILQQTIQE